jgi:molybdate transport system permease protein
MSAVRTTITAAAAALGMAWVVPEARADSLTVSAAASLRPALEEAERVFVRMRPEARIVWNFGASGALRQQIEQGAPVDVFLPAAPGPMDRLEAKGLVAAGTRADLLHNEVVLIAPAAAARPRGFADLTDPGIRTLALGDPASVPAGEYGRDVLRSLGLWEAVSSRLVLAKDVRQVLTYVAAGDADAGIVYASDARGVDRVRVAAVAPPGSHAPIVYPVAVLAGARQPALAREFVAFLRGREAGEVFARFGLLPGWPALARPAEPRKPFDLSPLWISVRTSLAATLLTFGLGLAAAWWMHGYRGRGRVVLDGLFLLPLVLPPTVIGFFLLLVLGRGSGLGRLLEQAGWTIAFSWPATVIAATVVAFPLMYRASLGALEQVAPSLPQAARTLGASEWRVFRRVSLPLAGPGILAGTVLAFARALGEFGATLMLAGNIPGRTQTMPVAIFFAAEGGEMDRALAWVLMTVAVSLGAIVALGYWSRYQPRRRRGGAGATEIEAGGAWLPPATDEAPARAGGATLAFRAARRYADFALNAEFATTGARLGLLGASGSGKSLTLRCLAGIETPDRGRMVLNGRVLFDDVEGINLPPAERRIGVLFQDYALFPHLTVADNIGFGLSGAPGAEREQRVAEMLRLVHLEGLRERYPEELSGGQRQRVALARALAPRPDALLLDEPFSALDPHLRRQLENQLREALRGYPGAVVLVTHDMEEAYRLGEELVVLDGGRVIAAGDRQRLFKRPGSVAAARLTGCKNIFAVAAGGDGWLSVPQLGIGLAGADPAGPPPTHVGIRARHLRLRVEGGGRINVFPCRLRALTESPHEVTLGLAVGESGAATLAMQMSREEWRIWRTRPQPWYVELPPEQLLWLVG